MKRSSDRILTSHVGSLARPQKLRDIIERREKGEAVDEAAFDKALRESVAEVVSQQAKVGIDIPSDGEYGKLGWNAYVTKRLSGMQSRPRQADDPKHISTHMAGRDGHKFPMKFFKAYGPIQMYDWSGPSFFVNRELVDKRRTGAEIVECVGPITYNDTEISPRHRQLQSRIGRTRISPTRLCRWRAPESARGDQMANRYYRRADDDAFLAAIGDAMKAEYPRHCRRAGLLIQLDDALLAHEYDRLLATQSETEVHKNFEAYIEMLNYSLSGIPEEKIRYHVCWGSWNVPHTTDVPLRTLLSLILKVKAQGYRIEAANPRHAHEFQVWEDVKLPEGKILLPGLVSHSTNVVEHPELVSLRIRNFAKSWSGERTSLPAPIAASRKNCSGIRFAFIRRCSGPSWRRWSRERVLRPRLYGRNAAKIIDFYTPHRRSFEKWFSRMSFERVIGLNFWVEISTGDHLSTTCIFERSGAFEVVALVLRRQFSKSRTSQAPALRTFNRSFRPPKSDGKSDCVEALHTEWLRPQPQDQHSAHVRYGSKGEMGQAFYGVRSYSKTRHWNSTQFSYCMLCERHFHIGYYAERRS